MPGLDASDYIAFLRLLEHDPQTIAAEAARLCASSEERIAALHIRIADAPEEEREIVRVTAGRSIRREEELLVRLRSDDPWAYWPVLPDDRLHGAAAWARQGYWQGFFPDPSSRFPLVQRQWQGDGLSPSIATFGFSPMRDRLVVWAMALWWVQVADKWMKGRLPVHLYAEIEAIHGNDWWADNLAGLVWGGGIGKPPSERERYIYNMRARGYSWERACRNVYADEATASMIAGHLAGWESRNLRMGYGHDKCS